MQISFNSTPFNFRICAAITDGGGTGPIVSGAFIYKVKRGTLSGHELRGGDRLIEIDGEDVTGLSLDEV